MVLLEATGLTFIMGIFPPFRIMLWLSALLVLVLLVYMAALVKLRAEEVERARRHRRAARGRGYTDAYGYTWPAPARAPYQQAAYGIENGYGDGYGNGQTARNGGGNGQGIDYAAEWLESGLRMVDDDVHVVVYRSDEIDTSSLTSAGR
jgi:hypothetical protein